jgi:squalene-associated FAD-dependent desaturase
MKIVVKKVAVIGAGWAGCAAAVDAARAGHHVTVFEASRTPGGRARRVNVAHSGQTLALDNGQHILIGAYTDTLKLMADVGVDVPASLHRMPLTMQFPDGGGLTLPRLPAPFDTLIGILRARGWSWSDKLSLLRTAMGWRLRKFQCPAEQSVKDLCSEMSPHVMATLIEPLCVAALNTPADRASGQVFLRVLRDSLFAASGGSDLLLPRVDLSALLPEAALAWLTAQGGSVQLGVRVQNITYQAGGRWHLRSGADADRGGFDCVVLACSALDAARLVQNINADCDAWLAQAQALQYEAIATIYALVPGYRLAKPMLALASSLEHPAQFVFDRGQLNGPAGLLAFVISASQQGSAEITERVAAQAKDQLGIAQLHLLQTVVEKRATFACTPGLQRPTQQIAPGLLACGDYVDGPYPATLEGAVRSGLQAASKL